jgi:hypothetical protein
VTLTTGTRLGPYEILSPLGAGAREHLRPLRRGDARGHRVPRHGAPRGTDSRRAPRKRPPPAGAAPEGVDRDRRRLAYQSNESGRSEVYVQNFPGPGGKWQISTSGGRDPQWRADGKELYYRAPDQKLMAVDIQAGGGMTVGAPHPLFQGRFDTGTARNRFLPTADGRRFLTVAPLSREAMTPTTVVLNWNAELGR